MNGSVATTQWSQVLAARDGEGTEGREALEQLCQTYWQPLYAYIRHQGSGPDEASDLTQGFFTELLEKDLLAEVDPEKGRFRAFLLASLRHFLANERRRQRTLKRGGGKRTLSLDTETGEQAYALLSGQQNSPADVFEQQWATTVLARAMVRLQLESEAAGNPTQFELLKQYLTGTDPQMPYRELAAAMAMTEGAIATAVHRLRLRYGECLRAEIAETVEDPVDVDGELRYLLAIVRPHHGGEP